MTTRSRSELVAALPEVRRLLDQLTAATRPAWALVLPKNPIGVSTRDA